MSTLMPETYSANDDGHIDARNISANDYGHIDARNMFSLEQ
jgi:hypothetical protein